MNKKKSKKILSVTVNAPILYKELAAFIHVKVLLKESATCNNTLGRVFHIIIYLNLSITSSSDWIGLLYFHNK